MIASSGYDAEKTGDKQDDYNNAAMRSFDGAQAYMDIVPDAQLPRKTLKAVLDHVRTERKITREQEEKYIMDLIDKAENSESPMSVYPKDAPEDKKWPKGSLSERFQQFYQESEQIVAQVGEAFERRDLAALGELVDKSQSLTDTHLKNLVDETRELPKMARTLGAHASSAFGAGFGGSCWAVIDASKAQKFSDDWKAAYLEKFPAWKEACLFFVMPPGPGAFKLGQSTGMYPMAVDRGC